MKESGDPEAKRFDVAGAVTFAGALFLLTLALISGNHQGWNSATVLTEIAGATALFVVFARIEKGVVRPMFDLRLFRRPTFLGATLAGLSYAASFFFTMLTYLPMFFQSALGLEAQSAGLLMLAFAVPLILVPRFISTRLVTRFSGRTVLCLAMGVLAAGISLLALFAAGAVHTVAARAYLPAIARRLHHGHDLPGEPFDFLTWFEYAPADAAAFNDLLGALRASAEWRYVEREVDIRLVRDVAGSRAS